MNVTRKGRLVFAAILIIFLYGMVGAMLGVLMPTLDLNVKQRSNVAFAQAIGLVVASLSAGPLIDKHGKKVALSIGLVLISVTLYTLPAAAGYGQILSCFFALGLASGMLGTSANMLASDVDERRRGSALNFLNLFFGVGLMTAPFLAANVLHGNKASLCYVEATLAAVTLACLAATPIGRPSSPSGFTVAEARHLIRRPLLWLFSLFLFLYVACEVGVSNWLATYLVSRGIPQTTALNILSVGFALGLLTGRLAVSGILMKVSAANVTLASPILMAVTTFLILQTSDPALATIAVFAAGFSMAPVFPTTLALMADAFPQMTATAMGIAITAGWAGLAASAPVIGVLAGSGSEHLGRALLLFPVASVAMIGVNLAARRLLARAEIPIRTPLHPPL